METDPKPYVPRCQCECDTEPSPNRRGAYVNIFMLGLTLLGIGWLVCFAYIPDEKNRVQFFLQIAPNLLIVAAMILHAYIYKRQWDAMQQALEHTDTLIKQNKEVITAMETQREISNRQVAIALRQFELTDRPWMAVDVALVSPLIFSDQGTELTFRITASVKLSLN